MKKKWSIGAMIWFVLMILGQWLMFIEYKTKPITAYNSDYQRATVIYFVAGVIGTALYLWLVIGKSKAALTTLLVVSGINAAITLFGSGLVTALISLICPAITFFVARNTVNSDEAPAETGSKTEPGIPTLETRAPAAADSTIPAYLQYPDDPISKTMFKDHMIQIKNERCAYRFLLYADGISPEPVVEQNSPPFDRNETHYYANPETPFWDTVSTMKHESVSTGSVVRWIQSDELSERMGAVDAFLRRPEFMRGRAYRAAAMLYDLGESAAYNTEHGFDESHVFCRVFYLDEQIYKKFILLARRKDWSWRCEVNIPAQRAEIMPPDFVPPGLVFGSFFPEL